MSAESLTVRRILTGSITMLRARPTDAVLALAVLTALGMGTDLSGEGPTTAFALAGAVANLCFVYQITKSQLAHRNLLPGGVPQRGLMALLGLQILVGLAVVLGFVFVIVPGLYLMARFASAVPILLAEDAGVIGAMQRSWDETSKEAIPILASFLVIYLPMWAAMGIVLMLTGDGITVLSSLGLNLALNASLILGWHAAVAIYASGRKAEELAEVFA